MKTALFFSFEAQEKAATKLKKWKKAVRFFLVLFSFFLYFIALIALFQFMPRWKPSACVHSNLFQLWQIDFVVAVVVWEWISKKMTLLWTRFVSASPLTAPARGRKKEEEKERLRYTCCLVRFTTRDRRMCVGLLFSCSLVPLCSGWKLNPFEWTCKSALGVNILLGWRRYPWTSWSRQDPLSFDIISSFFFIQRDHFCINNSFNCCCCSRDRVSCGLSWKGAQVTQDPDPCWLWRFFFLLASSVFHQRLSSHRCDFSLVCTYRNRGQGKACARGCGGKILVCGGAVWVAVHLGTRFHPGLFKPVPQGPGLAGTGWRGNCDTFLVNCGELEVLTNFFSTIVLLVFPSSSLSLSFVQLHSTTPTSAAPVTS